jgi:murein DD-endopeptidase MepM/ murein hydrolase activator NlpD
MNIKQTLKYLIVLPFCFLTIEKNEAQVFSKKNYNKNYFTWPLDANIDIVANFGELRPNHYHMGLDCRTNQRENLAVIASADGYIAKVKIEPFGFGRCIYINHPNGLTTVYAHLNAFDEALEKYVTEQQYKLNQWNVFLDIPKDLFPVTKGDFIANSGNTGGSQGPHTHFEIRETKTDKCLNVLMFGLPINDNLDPEILRLAVYDRTISTYEQSPKFYNLRKVNGEYEVVGGKVIAPSSRVSFALTMQDRVNGGRGANGVYAAAVLDNDIQISRFELDGISYAETRFFNAHIDYKLKANGGPYVQHLSPLPGYLNKIYTTDNNNGVVVFNDSTAHAIKIIVSDANGNLSFLKFNLLPNKINPIKKLYPDTKKFIPNVANFFENNNIRVNMPQGTIYDTIQFTYKELPSATGKNIYQLHNASIPVQSQYPISIRENFATSDTGKIVMKRVTGSKQDYAKATNKNGWYTSSFRDFGTFQLMIDNEPPTITPIGFSNGMNATNAKRIIFRVKDNTENIASFNAYLDGEWLRFTNDKGTNFIYNFDERCETGEHELKIIAVDQVGNKAERVYTFTR